MNEDFNNILEQLKGYKETPPESVWQRISYHLDRKGFFKNRPNKQYLYPAVITLILLLWFFNEWFSFFHLGKSRIITAQQAHQMYVSPLIYPSRIYQQTISLPVYLYYVPSNYVTVNNSSAFSTNMLFSKENNYAESENIKATEDIYLLKAIGLEQLPLFLSPDSFKKYPLFSPFEIPNSWFAVELTGMGFEKTYVPELYKSTPINGYNWGATIAYFSNNLYAGTGVFVHKIYAPNTYNYSRYQSFVKGYTMGIDSMVLVQSEEDKISFYPLVYTGYHPVYDSVLKNYQIQHLDVYHFVEIPLFVGFQNQINRFGFKAELGLGINLRQGMKLYTKEKFSEEFGIMPVDWKPLNFTMSSSFYNFTIKGGIFYQFLPSWSAGLNVQFRNYLSPMFENEGKNLNYPYSFGMNLSLSKTL